MIRTRKGRLVLFVFSAALGFVIGCASSECGPRFPLLGRRLRHAEECPCTVEDGGTFVTSEGPVLIDGATTSQPAVTTQPVPAPTPRLAPTPQAQPQPYQPQRRIKKSDD